MKEKELIRLNKANELDKLIKFYEHELSIISHNKNNTYTIDIEESFGDQNRHRTRIHENSRYKFIVNVGMCKMLEHIVNELKTEFDRI